MLTYHSSDFHFHTGYSFLFLGKYIGNIFIPLFYHPARRRIKLAAACLTIEIFGSATLLTSGLARSAHRGRILFFSIQKSNIPPPFAMPPSTRSLDGALHSSSDSVQVSSWNDSMTVNELKTQLKNRNLPVSGVKSVLIQRLEEYQQQPSQTSATTTKSKYFSTPTKNDKRRKQSTPGSVEFGIADDETPSPKKASARKKTKSPSPITPEQTKKGGEIVTTPMKRKSPPKKSKSTSPRKRVKIVPGSLDPPENWEKVYKMVEELRSDRSAPVDTDGGEMLPEKQHGPVVHRFQVLTALMLSSQTKDGVVGQTMKALQKHGLTVQNIHNTDHETLNGLIGKVGFHNNKTNYMKKAAEIIITQYNGDIPPNADEMMKLPGVGPKMAYIIEQICFGTSSGIGVDTHMHRLL